MTTCWQLFSNMLLAKFASSIVSGKFTVFHSSFKIPYLMLALPLLQGLDDESCKETVSQSGNFYYPGEKTKCNWLLMDEKSTSML